jgi:hypothetical protein
MHAFSVVPRIFCEAGLAQSGASRVVRSGPIVPVEAAAASVWQLAHPEARNTALPAAAAAGEVALVFAGVLGVVVVVDVLAGVVEVLAGVVEVLAAGVAEDPLEDAPAAVGGAGSVRPGGRPVGTPRAE